MVYHGGIMATFNGYKETIIWKSMDIQWDIQWIKHVNQSTKILQRNEWELNHKLWKSLSLDWLKVLGSAPQV